MPLALSTSLSCLSSIQQVLCVLLKFQFWGSKDKHSTCKEFKWNTGWDKHGWWPERRSSEITFTLFNSNMAEVANGLSEDWCLPAAPLTMKDHGEVSLDRDSYVHITTTLQRGGKEPASEQVVSYGATFSCSGIPTGNPWWSLWETCEVERFVGKFYKEMENQKKNMAYCWVCRKSDMRLDKWNVMNSWRASTAQSARVGRSDAMWRMIKIIWGGDKSRANQPPLCNLSHDIMTTGRTSSSDAIPLPLFCQTQE